MQYITTGNRIAVENFTLGDLYTITFTNGTYINSACIGIGENFVSFQRNEPELLFTLNMETAELVSSIDLYAGGTGTNNYNDLTNKPQINDVELVGNKSLSDLGIQPTISDLDTIRSGAAAGATAVQPAALADYQPIISDLDTIRSGAAAGATAVQPAALADYQPKIDSSHKLDADLVDDTSSAHKFATAAQLSQIGINENNILFNTNMGVKNIINVQVPSTVVRTSYTPLSNGGVELSCTSAIWTAYNIENIGIEAGVSYTIKILVDESTATDLHIYVREIDASGTNLASKYYGNETGEYNADFTSSSGTTWLGIYLNNSATARTATAKIRVMICPKTIYDTDNSYQPYAMSNAEITAWILAQS